MTDHYQPLRIFSGHLSDVTCTRFHPNSNYVATGSADRTIRLWDVLNGNCVRILTGHKVGSPARVAGRDLAETGVSNGLSFLTLGADPLAGVFSQRQVPGVRRHGRTGAAVGHRARAAGGGAKRPHGHRLLSQVQSGRRDTSLR